MDHSIWRLLTACAFLFAGCEKAIQFTPVEQAPKLVVEATIEDGRYPMVTLTTSLNFFSRISISELANSFVKGAEIVVSNGPDSQKLKEYTQQAGGYSITYYTVDSSDIDHGFKGALGNQYTMKITSAGKVYTAETTIPLLTKQISSLYYQTNVDKDDSSKVALFARFDDPSGLGNYLRYFTRVGDEPFYPGLNSVFDDKVVDGKSYSMQVDRGVDRNSDIDYDDYAFFNKGDTITVKLCDIDKGVYDFWRTMEYGYSSVGNPFSSPTKVIGNISNGALGYFGGYAVQYSSVVIPE